MVLLLAATAFGWSCPAPPPPSASVESVARRSLWLQVIGTAGSRGGSVTDLHGGPGWAGTLRDWRRDVAVLRTRAIEALHADDRAWLDAYVAGSRRPRVAAAVEACIAERGLAPVRATFGPDDAALGRWFAAEAIRAGKAHDAAPWFEAVGLHRAAVVSRFLAGDAEALLELGDTDAFLERADATSLAAWLADNPRHGRASEARVLLDAALAEAERWDEVRDPALARTGLRLRAWEASPTGGPWYGRLAAAVGEHPTLDEARQLAGHAAAAGLRAEEWRWVERGFALDARGEAGAVGTFELALGSLASDYAHGGIDAVVSGPPAGVRDEESLRAEVATLVVDGDMPTRARAANRTLWLARELVQAADDEEARSEGLYRVGKALLDVDDAFRDWPRPWDPTTMHYIPTRGDSGIERLGRDILADTLARAARLHAWNVWVERAEALLGRRWPKEWAVQRKETPARSRVEELPFAGPAAW